MCTYLTLTTDIKGIGLAGDDPLRLEAAVVSFDHPQEAALEHALCIDFRSADASRRIAVELDDQSARRLAERILSVLDDPETRALTGGLGGSTQPAPPDSDRLNWRAGVACGPPIEG